jgi:myosin heavy subunit
MRRFKVQKEIRMQKNAATKIQTVFRGYVARNRYQQIQKAVQKCQELYRAKISGQQKRYEYLLKKLSALVIQRHYRHYKVKQEVKKNNNAATRIQAIYRCYRERLFLNFKASHMGLNFNNSTLLPHVL